MLPRFFPSTFRTAAFLKPKAYPQTVSTGVVERPREEYRVKDRRNIRGPWGWLVRGRMKEFRRGRRGGRVGRVGEGRVGWKRNVRRRLDVRRVRKRGREMGRREDLEGDLEEDLEEVGVEEEMSPPRIDRSSFGIECEAMCEEM